MKLFGGILTLLALTLNPSLSTADASGQSPRFLVHLLDYIALDYSGAVADGKVINQPEYQEQLEFAGAAIQTAKALELDKDAALTEQLSGLRQLILKKAPVEAVRPLCREIEAKVIKLGKIDVSPTHWPNRKEGHLIYQKNCIACHGVQGRGDGLAGRALDPKPANFFDDKMGEMAPFQLFNAIRLGVPGTAMAPYTQFSDQEIWDLAFYVLSLRYEGKTADNAISVPSTISLKEVSTLSDLALKRLLPGSHAEQELLLARVRLYTPATENADAFCLIAQGNLDGALRDYRSGNASEAKKKAVMAYLEGVEPIEPRLRVKDAAFTAQLEMSMAAVRAAIDGAQSAEVTESKIKDAKNLLRRAEDMLHESHSSAWLTFTVAAGIFLREAFEAVLIIITLLGVLSSIGSRKAIVYVHGGWILAVLFGILAWFFSGWVVLISGAQRELIEGVISFIAVFVLLYFGFWLHRKTEIGKWRAFIDEMVKSAVQEKNLIGLGSIAFMAVFREMFEVVLFLRVLLVESGNTQQVPMALGVGISLAIVMVLAACLVRFSARIPIRQLFSISAGVMVFLSVILMGKALHSFQETGLLSITLFPASLHSDLMGLYPTYETLIPQALVLLAGILLWLSHRCPSPFRPKR